MIARGSFSLACIRSDRCSACTGPAPASAWSRTARTSAILLPNALYTVSSDTPASSAILAIVVPGESLAQKEAARRLDDRGTSPSRRFLPSRRVVSPRALDFRGHEAQYTFNYSNDCINYGVALMTNHDTIDGAAGVLARLERATNAHDVNAWWRASLPDYRNDTPAHPERSFTGREQVRRNWEQIFAAIPDLTARVLRSAVNGGEVWSEWEHRGTRRDGSAHVMRGVVIFGVANGLLTWARFYLEPVQEGGGNVDAAVRRQVAPVRPCHPGASSERP